MRAPGAPCIRRSRLLARAKAWAAKRLKSCSRVSWACGVSIRRMFSPSGGIAKSAGSTSLRRCGSPSITAVASTVSFIDLTPTQQPEKRLSAQPVSMVSISSCTPAGARIGSMASISAISDWWQVVELSQVWSSPIATSTPPYFDVPAKLAWRNTSPLRSTPGPLPYQSPNTPWCLPSPRSSACWVPHSAVAARSSLRPGWNLTCASARYFCAAWKTPSTAPSGEPR